MQTTILILRGLGKSCQTIVVTRSIQPIKSTPKQQAETARQSCHISLEILSNTRLPQYLRRANQSPPPVGGGAERMLGTSEVLRHWCAAAPCQHPLMISPLLRFRLQYIAMTVATSALLRSRKNGGWARRRLLFHRSDRKPRAECKSHLCYVYVRMG